MAKKSRYAGHYRAVINRKKKPEQSRQKSVLSKLKEMKKQEG